MKLSKEKRDKISEQILAFLYQSFPKARFTAEIAGEIARDEEFVKDILFELKDKNLVMAVFASIYQMRFRLSLVSRNADRYNRH
jgi:hypothetical protein